MKLPKFVITAVFWGSVLAFTAFSLRMARGLEFSGVHFQGLEFINRDWIVNLEHFIGAIGFCLVFVGMLSSFFSIKGKKELVDTCNKWLKRIMFGAPLFYLFFSFCWEFNTGFLVEKGSTTNQFLYDAVGVFFTLALLASLRVRYESSGHPTPSEARAH